MKITSPDLMKLNNKRQILEIIYKEKNIYRAQIANLTNMSNQTITNLVKELVEEGSVIEKPMKTNTKGRAPIALSINLINQYVIGIELSVSGIVYALYTAEGKEIEKIQELPGDDVISQLKTNITKLMNDIDSKQLLGIGMSVEGIMNEAKGYVISAKDLGLYHINLMDELKHFNVPIIIRHDVNVLAEVFAYDVDINNLMMVKIDRGIGASLILNNKILTSDSKVVGEMGHVVLHSLKHPKQCRCGKKGCLTTEASIYAIETSMDKTLDEIVTLYQNNDPKTLVAIHNISNHIAEAITNFVSLLGLECVVLNGRIFDILGDQFFVETKEAIIEHLDIWHKDLVIKRLEAIDVSKFCSELVVKRYYTNESELI